MKFLVITFLVAMMNALVPNGYAAPGYAFEGVRETREQTQERFRAIAEAVVDVAYDPGERAIFQGAHGRGRTAVLILAVAFWETRFRRDADLGVGKGARGDNGKSWCLMQLNIDRGKTQEGWTGPELVADRRKCISAGLHLLQQTWGCGPDQADALSTYASGQCVTAARVRAEQDLSERRKLENIRTASARRVATAVRFGALLKVTDEQATAAPEQARSED